MFYQRGLGGGASADDLIGAGYWGLAVAAGKYDFREGVRFSSFAWSHVKGTIQHYVRDHARSVRLPRFVLQHRKTVYAMRAQKKSEQEIQKVTGLGPLEQTQCVQSFRQEHIPIDTTLREDCAPLQLVSETKSQSYVEDFSPQVREYIETLDPKVISALEYFFIKKGVKKQTQGVKLERANKAIAEIKRLAAMYPA